MSGAWKYLKSFVTEDVLETAASPINGQLEVCYVNGRKMLNAEAVNYSFGDLDRVFRSAFAQLKVEKRSICDILLLGLGAGNVPTILSGHDRVYHITGVEVDAEILRLGRNYFGLDDYENVRIVEADAMEYVKGKNQRYDLIIVDLFIDELVPEGATRAEFIGHLDYLLRPDGLLMYNRLMHSPALRQQTEAFTRKLQEWLPGTDFIKAHHNRMLYYEKKF